MIKRLFIPDVHAPYHDAKAFWLMLDIAKDFKPDEVIILGDFFDVYTCSSHRLDPTKAMPLLEDELKVGRKLLGHIEKVCSKAKKFIFLEGNHENRITRYMESYAPKFGGIMHTRDILQIPKKWKYLPYGMEGHYEMANGNFVATHGSITSKYFTAALIAKYGVSVICGHTHRIQHHVVKTFNGDRIEALSPGWLGSNEASEYINNVADFSHGFALGTFEGNNFWIEIIQIKDYRAAFNGKLYRR